MKTRILFFLFISVSFLGCSQSSDSYLFYGIDAKGYTTQRERDSHEDSLFVKMGNDLTFLLDNGKISDREYEAAKVFQQMITNYPPKMRKMDIQMTKLLSPDNLEILESEGIVVEPQRAINNELFCMAEMVKVVDLYIIQYRFHDEWIQAMLKGEEHTSPLDIDYLDHSLEQVADMREWHRVVLNKMKMIDKKINAK